MPPSPIWKGQLKISLVMVPVRLYSVVSSSSKVAFNQLHRGGHHRIRHANECPEHGKVERYDIVKGYEYDRGKYVVVDEADFENVRVETTRTIDLVQFVGVDEIHSIYLNTPYYIGPDGPVAEQPFGVIREAMRRAKKVGVGRVVLHQREHVIALAPHDAGFVMTTLRYADEVNQCDRYFEEIGEGPVAEDELELAQKLIDGRTARFEPGQFKDRYRDGLLEIIKAKVEGTGAVVPQEDEAGEVINFMDALRQSVAEMPKKKPPAKSVKSASTRRRKKA